MIHFNLISCVQVIGTLSQSVTYDALVPTALNRANAPSRDESVVQLSRSYLTVVGINFGGLLLPYDVLTASEAARQRRVILGVSSTPSVLWTSDSALTCRAVPGLAKTRDVVVTVGMRMATGSLLLSYNAPAILQGSSNATFNFVRSMRYSSNMILDVYLGPYNPSPSLRFLTSSEQSVWLSESRILCMPSFGTKYSIAIALTSGSSVGSSSNIFSYNVPVLSYSNPQNQATKGFSSVSLTGFSLGLSDSSPSAKFGRTVSTATIWSSDSACFTRASASFASSLLFALTGGIRLQTTTAAYSFDGVKMLGVNGTANAAKTGRQMIALLCQNCAPSVASRTGFTGSDRSIWISDSAVFAKSVFGILKTLTFAITSAVAPATRTQMGSYDTAELAVLPNPNSFTGGSTLVIVTGISLGGQGYTQRSRVGGSAGQTTMWISDTSVAPKLSPGVSSSIDLAFTAFRERSSLSRSFSFDSASLTLIAKNVQNSYPAIHLFGSFVFFANSGRFDSSLQMVFGQTRADSSTWISDSCVFSKIPSGLGQSLRLYLTIQILRGNSQLRLASYDSEIVSSLAPVNYPSSFDKFISLSATNGGIALYSGAIRSAASKCESSFWFSDTSLTAKTPLGFRNTRSLVLTQGIYVSSQSCSVSYDDSFLVAISAGNTPVFSNRIQAVLLSGGLQMIGQLLTIQLKMMGTGCESTFWGSESAIYCQTAAGAVSKYGIAFNKIVLTAGEVASTLSQAFTYDDNVVSSEGVSNSAVSGARSILFYGRNLGRFSMSDATRIGNTGCETTLWVCDSSILGFVSASLSGGSLGVYITAILASASFTMGWSYDKPSMSVLKSSNVPGATAFATNPISQLDSFLFGNSFSHDDASLRSRMGVTASEKSVWVSDSGLLTRPAFGFSKSRALFLTIQVAEGSVSKSFSYLAPNLSVIVTSNGHTSGSMSVTLLGKYFVFERCLAARISSTSAEGTVWVSDSAVGVLIAAGGFASYRTSVTAGVQIGSISNFLSLGLPQISGVQRSNSVANSVHSPFILGSGSMLQSNTVGARNGFTSVAMSSWSSDTSVLCAIASSQQSSSRVVITAGSRTSSLTSAVSQDQFLILNAGQGNFPKTGAVSLSIVGSQLGVIISSCPLRQHVSNCEASLWKSDSSLVCKTTAGLIYALLSPARLILSVGERAGSSSSMFSMSTAQLSSTKASNGAIGSVRDSITVSGSGFGVNSCCVIAGFGLTSAESTLWNSDTSVPIRRAKGHQRSLSSVATIGHVPSSKTEGLSFNAPSCRNQVGDNHLKNRPSTGTSLLTIGGNSFGVSSVCPGSIISSTQCESSSWDSDTGLICKVVPFGSRTLRATLTVGISDATLSESFSFDIPNLSATYDGNRLIIGHITVRIAGSGFGNPESSLGARSSRTACEKSSWMGDTEISCLQGSFANTGLSKRLTFTVSRRSASVSDALSFNTASFALSKARYNIPITGTSLFTVWGINMGTGTVSAFSRAGFTGAQLTKWISDSSMWCAPSGGLHRCRSLLVTSGCALGCATNALSFAGISPSSFSVSNHATTGTVSVSIHGMGFGLYMVTNKVRLGHSSFESTNWISTSTVASRTVSGVRVSCLTTVTAQLGLNTLTEAQSWDKPLLAKRNLIATWCTVATFVNCSVGANCSMPCNTNKKIFSNCTRNSTVLCRNPAYNGPSYSGQELISGHNFGLSRMSLHSRLGRTECEKTEWNSDTAVRFRVSLGLESSRAIVMTGSMQAGTTSQLYSFDTPSVRAARLVGQQFMTIALSVQCSEELQNDLLKSFAPPSLLNLSDSSLEPPSVMPRPSQPSRNDNYTFLYAFIQKIPCVYAHVSRVISTSATLQSAVLEQSIGLRNVSSFSTRKLDCQLPKSAILQTADNVNTSWLGNLSGGKVNVTVFSSKVSCSKLNWLSDTSAKCDLEGVPQTVSVPLKCAATFQIDACLSGDSLVSECLIYDSAACAVDSAQKIRGNLGGNTPPTSPIWSIGAISAFGMDSSSVSARTGRTTSPHSQWISDSSIECRVAAGVHGTYTAIVTAGMAVGSLTQCSSYDSPSLKSMILVVNVPTTGSVSVTAIGSSMSGFGYTSVTRVYSRAESNMWVSDTSVMAKISGGAAARLRILTTVGSRLGGTLTDSLSYDSPNAYYVVPSSRPSTGVTTVSIIGSNLAIGALSQQVRIGGTPCESARWISSSTLLCRVAAGVHTMQQVIVTALQQTSNFPPDPQQMGRPKWPLFFFSYLAPIIYNTPSPSGPMAYGSTRGGWTLTIQGANFGTASDLVRVSLGSNIWASKRIDCKLVRASLCVGCGDAQLSDSLVHCLVPPGDGSSLGIVMEVGDQTNVFADGFSYARPVIRSVSSWDTCDSATCGSLSTVGLETSNPAEGPYPSDTKTLRLLVLTGENLGVSETMTSVPLPSVRSSLTPTEVSIGTAACSNVVVSAAGTLLTCLAPVPHLPNSIYGTVGCQALRLVVSTRNQTSAPFSRFGLVYLENMPTVIPTAGSSVRGYAWMDGDGAGMTLQFGIQAGTKGDVWAPVRTNQGRQYLNRPGARSDDFSYVCTPSPAPQGDTSCGKYLVSKLSTDLWSIIGADAICSWPSDSVLHVRFGFGATLVPSLQPPAIIKTRPGVVMNFGAPSYAVDVDILVVPPTTIRYPPDGSTAQNGGTPSARAVPPRVVLQSPAYIGPCDNLMVTALVDFGSGSRDAGLTYVWSSSPDLTQIRNTPTTGLAASTAVVPYNDRELDYGVAYTVTVIVTNYLGQQVTASVTVIREQIGVPTVMILGGTVRRIRRDQMVVINAAANLPACLGSGCTCTTGGSRVSNTAGWGGAAAVLEFQWSEVGATLGLQQAAALGTNSILVLPVSAISKLVVGSNYTLQVEAGVWTGFAKNDINFYSTIAEVILFPYSVPPVARIRYGNRDFSQGDPFTLDGSASFDPDALFENSLKFSWYLDAGAMYDRMPLHLKEQRGLMSPGVVTRKSYITLLQSQTTLGRMILKTNLQKYSVLQTDADFLLESTAIIPEIDFEYFVWGGATPVPKPSIPWPVLVVIGLYVTDVDNVVTYTSVELSFFDPSSLSEEESPLGIKYSAFPVSIEPLLDIFPIAENDLVLRVRLDDKTMNKVSYLISRGSGRNRPFVTIV